MNIEKVIESLEEGTVASLNDAKKAITPQQAIILQTAALICAHIADALKAGQEDKPDPDLQNKKNHL